MELIMVFPIKLKKLFASYFSAWEMITRINVELEKCNGQRTIKKWKME